MIKASSVTGAVAALAGPSASVKGYRPVSGGDINSAFRLELSSGGPLFLKCNRPENLDFFTAEAAGLQALRGTGTIGVPEPLALGTDRARGVSFLLMEYLEPGPRAPRYWEIFGRQLAAMHLAPCRPLEGGPFGFTADNFIGASPQDNTQADSWVTFFRDRRLAPQAARAGKYLDRATAAGLERLMDRLGELLPEPEFPSLIHGDLWSGNAVTGPDGLAWILDPAAYLGHFEAELAMTRLFGGFPQKFYDAYGEVSRIAPGFEERMDIYNLYHLLNHLNLFGAAYLGPVRDTVRRYGR